MLVRPPGDLGAAVAVGRAPEELANHIRLGRVWDELTRSGIREVAERYAPARPEPPSALRGPRVAQALADEVALKLAERGQHVVHKPAHHRAHAVAAGSDHDELHAGPLEELLKTGPVAHAAGQPVEPLHDDGVDLSAGDGRDHPHQSRPPEGAAADAHVVEAVIDQLPALVLHRANERLAGLPLGLARGVVELAVDGLPRVDGASDPGPVETRRHSQ